MNKAILKTGVQKFIKNNWNTDIVSVLLKRQLFKGVSQKELAVQLEAKKKCLQKLPTWFNTPNIYYPNKLNIEQTSSEKTASYKANLVDGKTMIDVTGGLGVDSYYFSKKMDAVFHCESNGKLSEIARYNFEVLGATNITSIHIDGIRFLTDSNERIDWVYMDPSRRNDIKGKVFRFVDCLPNIPEHLSSIFGKTDKILVKASPLLDISMGISELRFAKEVHIVAVNNEVKELLLILEHGHDAAIQIKTVNIRENHEESYTFSMDEERNAIAEFGEPAAYLYEPNAAILKSGGFKSIGNAFGLKKLHENSHLYTSDSLSDFPGRRFKILDVLSYRKKEVRKFTGTKANVTTRNFAESVAEVRKKFKIRDGGNAYLFFTRDLTGKSVVLSCTKV